MIPLNYITEWRQFAPWVLDRQVEQDLLISRTLVLIFNHSELFKTLAFRGGTALYKLFIKPGARYSEDIDLVQINAAPIGPIINHIRQVLDPLLGEPKRKLNEGRVTLSYRFLSEGTPPLPMRLKIEINTREHFSLYGFQSMPFSVDSTWFTGTAEIKTYQLEELIGTKIRALYQRKKGRDILDLSLALQQPNFDIQKAVNAFKYYMEQENKKITRAQFEANLEEKLKSAYFLQDVNSLVTTDFKWDINQAAKIINERLLPYLDKN